MNARGYTHPDKVFWPGEGYTKGDVLRYYETMAAVMLPYLKGRPENLNRHPSGWKGKHFFQKNFTSRVPAFVKTAAIWAKSDRKKLRYLVCNNKETLLYMINLGCIEINPWSSRLPHLDKPDYLILDLDPDGNHFDEVVAVAQEARRVLEAAGARPLVKTSGKTGMHVAAPLGGRYLHERVRAFARNAAQLIHRTLPSFTALERDPRKRRGKIYLDYLQNGRGQTIAAPYSIRPFPGATVSAPLAWNEVRQGLSPSRFTVRTMGKRVRRKSDLWKPLLSGALDLAQAERRLSELLART